MDGGSIKKLFIGPPNLLEGNGVAFEKITINNLCIQVLMGVGVYKNILTTPPPQPQNVLIGAGFIKNLLTTPHTQKMV